MIRWYSGFFVSNEHWCQKSKKKSVFNTISRFIYTNKAVTLRFI